MQNTRAKLKYADYGKWAGKELQSPYFPMTSGPVKIFAKMVLDNHDRPADPTNRLNRVRTRLAISSADSETRYLSSRNSQSITMLKPALALAILTKLAEAAVPLWGQCGGTGYTGETTCAAPGTCVYSNPWYSQCLAVTTTATSTTSSSRTSSRTTIVDASPYPSTSRTSTTSTSTSSTPAGTGFVKTSGQKFVLNGKTFTLAGHNSYWMAQLGSSTDIDAAFKDIAKTGATTVRTWGFNEVTSPSGTYYQSWSGSTATINTGSNGLAKFDTVVSLAKANNLKLI
ncbi:hypothetical protein FRC03_006335, partial [Tulasnella sp. 419]